MRTFALIAFFPAVLAADIEVELLYRRMIAMTTTASAAQTQCTYTPPPSNCEISCGKGNIPCVNNTRCYNPDEGEVCCKDGKYCPRNTYCTDVGCCSIFYTLKQCGAHEIQNYEPPEQRSSTTEKPTSTSSASTSSAASSTSFMTSSSAQPTSSSNTKDEKGGGNGVSKKVSAIIGGVVGGLAVIGVAVIGVVWMVLRSRTKATTTTSAAVGEGDPYNNLGFKEQRERESDGSGREISRSVMGYYAPSPALSPTEATSSTHFYSLSAPRRVTELDAEGIYRTNPAAGSAVDDITSGSEEVRSPKDAK